MCKTYLLTALLYTVDSLVYSLGKLMTHWNLQMKLGNMGKISACYRSYIVTRRETLQKEICLNLALEFFVSWIYYTENQNYKRNRFAFLMSSNCVNCEFPSHLLLSLYLLLETCSTQQTTILSNNERKCALILKIWQIQQMLILNLTAKRFYVGS